MNGPSEQMLPGNQKIEFATGPLRSSDLQRSKPRCHTQDDGAQTLQLAADWKQRVWPSEQYSRKLIKCQSIT